MVKYCLDANILIEPWTKHYSMELCPEYWELIDVLAKRQAIFCTMEVKKEIERIDDPLSKWIGKRPYLFKEVDERVFRNLQRIYEDPKRRRIVDSAKFRSLADPWVIAHALAENAIVVTKEGFETNSSKRIKIPNICVEMQVPWMDEFRFLHEIGIRFTAKLANDI